MQIQVVGNNPTARSLSALLRKADFPLVTKQPLLPTTAFYRIHIEETKADGVVVDSVDGPLDALVRSQLEELLKADVDVQHVEGKIFSDNEIRVVIPKGDAVASEAVVTAVRRALDLFLMGPALKGAKREKRVRRVSIAIIGLLVIALLLLAFSGKAHAQGIQQPTGSAPIKVNCVAGCSASSAANQTANGTVNAINGAVTFSVPGVGSVAAQITGTWTGTIEFEGTVDNSNWFSIKALPPTSSTTATNSSANGQWVIGAAGYHAVRFRASAWTSGTATIYAEGSSGTQFTINASGGGGGDGKILDGAGAGEADVMGSSPAGTEQGLVTRNIPSGTQTVSGTVTANAGSGTFTNQQSNITADYDTGAGTQTTTMFGVALPKSGGAVAGGTSTDPIRTDPTGTTTQPVSGTVTANAGTGTFNIQSNASVNVAQVNGVTTSTGNGVSGTGVQRVTIASDNTGFAVNNTQQGTASQNVAQFGGTNVTTGTGVGGAGIPRVTISNDSSLAANQSVNINQIAAVTPVMAAASTAAAAADRGLVVSISPNGGNPCQNPAATLSAVAGATSGTAAVQLVALSGSTKIYICSVNVTGVSGTTPTFSLKYGTGTACATGGVTILGAWTTTANTVYTFNQPFVTPAGQALCYLDSGTTPVQNYAITYVQQ